MFHLNSCQLKAPWFFSKRVPISSTITKKIKKMKVYFLNKKTFNFHDRGKWIKSKISISKIINKIINMKNRIEKGFRLDLNVSIPHSKAVLASRPFISIHKDARKITITKTIVKENTIIIEDNKFIYSISRSLLHK